MQLVTPGDRQSSIKIVGYWGTLWNKLVKFLILFALNKCGMGSNQMAKV